MRLALGVCRSPFASTNLYARVIDRLPPFAQRARKEWGTRQFMGDSDRVRQKPWHVLAGFLWARGMTRSGGNLGVGTIDCRMA